MVTKTPVQPVLLSTAPLLSTVFSLHSVSFVQFSLPDTLNTCLARGGFECEYGNNTQHAMGRCHTVTVLNNFKNNSVYGDLKGNEKKDLVTAGSFPKCLQ